MTVVVAARRPGSKPSIAASLPAKLFGRFAPNGPGATPAVDKPAKSQRRSVDRSADVQAMAHPKENASQSGPYMAAVRTLACRRCGFPKSQFAHADQGKGKNLKTDVRRGAALCGPHKGAGGKSEPGCHWLLGSSGKIPKAERRELEKQYAASTRAQVRAKGLWPKKLGQWDEKSDRPKDSR